MTNVIAIDGVGTGNSTDIFLHSPTADTSFADKVRPACANVGLFAISRRQHMLLEFGKVRTNTQSASALNSVNVQLASNSVCCSLNVDNHLPHQLTEESRLLTGQRSPDTVVVRNCGRTSVSEWRDDCRSVAC